MIAQSLIDVLQGMSEGKTIQACLNGIGDHKWVSISSPTVVMLASYAAQDIELRVKPEAKTIWCVMFNSGTIVAYGSEAECNENLHNCGMIAKFIQVLD